MRRLLLLSAFVATSAAAQTIAITGGTVFPVSGPKIVGGTVVITNGRITAVGTNVAIPAGAERIDATGKWVTPGFINGATSLGLSDAGSPQFSGGYNDTRATGTKGMAASFNAWEGINPASVLFAPARQEGVTSAFVGPAGGLFGGRGAVVDLTGSTVAAMVAKAPVAMVLHFDPSAGGLGARGELVGALRDLFADAKAYAARRTAYEANQTRAFAASRSDLEALQPVLAGTQPLLVDVDRASDIRAVLALGKQYGLKLILTGAAEAWQVADELKAAKVPVLVGAMSNIPTTFDALGSRQDNAALLHAAGVAVSLIDNGNGAGDFNARNMRQEAGNAVAYGLPWDEALRAITLGPAEAFGVADRLGSLGAGKSANVVVWSGDPFEFGSRAERVYIRGVLQTGKSRQDELAERYRKLPPAWRNP